jgi:hypothetical protein
MDEGIQLGRMAQIVNTLDKLLKSGTAADTTRALGLTCQMLQQLELRGDEEGIDGFVRQIWPGHVIDAPPSPCLEELCDDPVLFAQFCDKEQALLEQAGVEGDVADWLMSEIRRSGDQLRAQEVTGRRFANGLQLLKSKVCSYPGTKQLMSVMVASASTKAQEWLPPRRRFVWGAAGPLMAATNAYLVTQGTDHELSVNLAASAFFLFGDGFMRD